MEDIYHRYHHNQSLEPELVALRQFETTLQYISLPVANHGIINEFIKFKYQDIKSDYTLVNSNQGKLIELINKKIMLYNTPELPPCLKHDILLKIVDLIIILSYDFRKNEIVKFIKTQLDAENIGLTHNVTEIIFEKLLHRRIITFDEFNNFLNDCSRPIIKHLNKKKLINNLINQNLSIISNYYKSINLSNLSKLFGVDIDEMMVIKMISKGDLNGKINQVNNMLVLNDEYQENNIYKMVDTLSFKLDRD